jgi:hypothetical protein
MAWPSAIDYNRAIQHPRTCFSDPELQQGQAAGMMGLPRPYSGNFADVYQVDCPNKQSWAVKCFTREVVDLRARYQAISEHLDAQKRKFIVPFQYLAEGIRVRDQWYPVVKMRWVEGLTLNEFVRDHAESSAYLERLTELWERLAVEMRDARLGHGDLQHGNVLLVPRESSLVLRLIDYDGMWVPALDGNPPGEVGHPDYQHPLRLEDGGYFPEVDRFSLLVIDVALRALAVGGAKLWERYDNGDNLLFRRSDFAEPGQSRLFTELLYHKSAEVRALAGHLLLASQGPLADVPFLPDLLARGPVLTDGELTRARSLVPPPERGMTEVPVIEPAPKARPASWGNINLPPPPAPTRPPAPAVPTPAPAHVAPTWLEGARSVPAGATPAPQPVSAPPPAAPAARQPEHLPEAIPLGPRNDPASAPAPVAVLVQLPVTTGQTAVEAYPVAETLKEVLPVTAEEAEAANGAANHPPARPLIGKTAIKSAFSTPGKPADNAVKPAPALRPALGRSSPQRRPGPPLALLWPVLVIGALLSLPLVALLMWALWPRPKVAPPPRPAVMELAPLTIKAGERKSLAVTVDRQGSTDVLVVRLDGLPPGVTAPAQTLGPTETTVKLEFRARADVASAAHSITVALLSEGKEKVGEGALRLTVRAFVAPEIISVAPEDVVLKPRERRVVEIKVDRKGNDGPLSVRADGLPPGVEALVVPAVTGGDVIVLELTARGDAEPLARFPKLTILVDELEGGAKTFKVTVMPALPDKKELAIGITAPATLALKTGETKDLELTLARGGYAGPVELELRGQPEGVTYAQGAGDVLSVTAADEAVVGTKAVKVVALVAGKQAGEASFELTVSKRVAVVPKRAVPAPRSVSFLSADHVTLEGTYYPSAEGKNAVCVLMLHEPGAGRHRGEEGWQSLAKALQRKGLAVLTFDYRAHGESVRVSFPFFLTGVNAQFQKKGAGAAASDLRGARLPASYLPWLVQDIAAARHFLDREHDAGSHNSRNLIVIGAGESSTWGLLWLATEQHRFAGRAAGPLRPKLGPARGPAESQDVIGTLWLGLAPMTPAVGKVVQDALKQAGRDRRPQMAFVYGKNDPQTATRATNYMKTSGAKGANAFRTVEVPDTGVAGRHLLVPGLGTEKLMVAEVATIIDRAKLRPWENRNAWFAAYHYAAGGWSMDILPQGVRGPLVPLERFGVRVR